MILNLTQHDATADQVRAGLVDAAPEKRARLRALLTVSDDALCASDGVLNDHLRGKAQAIVTEFVVPIIADRYRKMLAGAFYWGAADGNQYRSFDEIVEGNPAYTDAALLAYVGDMPRVLCMVGGQPDLMEYLEKAIRAAGAVPVRALSARVSEDQAQPDGTVRKVSVFRHIRFRECGQGR